MYICSVLCRYCTVRLGLGLYYGLDFFPLASWASWSQRHMYIYLTYVLSGCVKGQESHETTEEEISGRIISLEFEFPARCAPARLPRASAHYPRMGDRKCQNVSISTLSKYLIRDPLGLLSVTSLPCVYTMYYFLFSLRLKKPWNNNK